MARMRRVLLVAALATLAGLAALTLVFAGNGAARVSGVHAAGATAPKGFDLYQTDPEQNVFRFVGKSAIPAGFFTPDSQPFEGDVNFGGDPIITFQGHDVGNADTVGERTADGAPGPNGTAGAAIPIELRALSLVSVAPIEVISGQTTQLWDVRATLSPSRPSTGSLRITQSDPNGGTFDSQLTVYPMFTFTRLSDGATKVIDVGALPDGSRPDEPIIGQATQWRAGCVPPALNIPSLNPGFCASQPPAGGTTLTIEQASNLRHGIRAASPRLEHFGCYIAPTGKGFKQRSVTLTDQFGTRDAKVVRGLTLCNPFRKNSEAPVVNKDDHLRCYQTDPGKSVGMSVLLRNQFGPFTADVLGARRLCVPSTKQVVKGNNVPRPPTQRFLVDHFQCYALSPSGDFTSRSFVLRDQFGKRKLKVGKPFLLCAPSKKNGTDVRDPVHHLVCYLARPARKVARRVSIHNQFGAELTRTKRVTEVCLPSIKIVRKL
jgi:hypothetical protein